MSILTMAVIAALLGSALIGGVFFAFSSFIMKALSRLPAPQGIGAMQSVNVVVLNASFLGVFTGTAVLCLLVGGLSVADWQAPSAPWYLTGAVTYVFGTFVLTGMGNVPLNNRLAAVSTEDPEAVAVWAHYLARWTRLNTIRTLAALVAALLFSLGLLAGA